MGEGTICASVRISNVVEMGDVRNLDYGRNAGLPSTDCSDCSSGKGKKSCNFASPFLNKTMFSVASPASTHSSSDAARENSFAESGARIRIRGRCNAPMFQGDTNNNYLSICF